jgi:hypothetical protein
MNKNKAGTAFHNWHKSNDFTHRQIDDRSERKEQETEDRNPTEVNDTGRVWSF